MPQIAGFRGLVWDSAKVELGKLATAPITSFAAQQTSGALVRDATRAVYAYHQTFALGGRTVTRKSLLAAVRLSPWTERSIRPHEVTDDSERARELAAITTNGGHGAPVLLGYRDASGEVDRALRSFGDGAAIAKLTTADGVEHKLVRIRSAELIGKLRPLFAPKTLHVLDGHARYEAMLAYAQTLGPDRLPQYASAHYGLGCLVQLDDQALLVAARHRIVRELAIGKPAVLEAARRYFIVEPIAGAASDVGRLQSALAETVAHQPAFVALFAGDRDAYKLTLSPDVLPTSEGVAVHRAVQKYDAVVLEHLLFGRVLAGQSAPAWDSTIDATYVVAAVGGGTPLGIVTRPMTLDQITHADEVGALLPAHTTAFPPTIAHCVAFVVDPNEDLV